MKAKTLSKLTEELDIIFSKYIRKSRADQYGMVTCDCGCGVRMHWKGAQLSHYISRVHRATRWDERNVFVATMACNYYDQDHVQKLYNHIVRRHGMSVIYSLNEIRQSKVKFMPYELEEMIKEYKQKFKAL